MSLKQFAEEVGGKCKSTENKDSRVSKVTVRLKGWVVTLKEEASRRATQGGYTWDTATSVEASFQPRDDLVLSAVRRPGALSVVWSAFGLGIGGAGTLGLVLMFVVAIATGRTGPNEASPALLAAPIVATGLVVFVGTFLYLLRPERGPGDAEVRRHFRVRGNNEDKAMAFFADSGIRRLFRNQPGGSSLDVTPPRRLLDRGPRRRGRPSAHLGRLRFWRPGDADSHQLRSLYELMAKSLDQLVAIGSASEAAPETPADSDGRAMGQQEDSPEHSNEMRIPHFRRLLIADDKVEVTPPLMFGSGFVFDRARRLVTIRFCLFRLALHSEEVRFSGVRVRLSHDGRVAQYAPHPFKHFFIELKFADGTRLKLCDGLETELYPTKASPETRRILNAIHRVLGQTSA